MSDGKQIGTEWQMGARMDRLTYIKADTRRLDRLLGRYGQIDK